MYYPQLFCGFPYMGGWQNAYLPQHTGYQMPMQHPVYPQPHIPFRAWAMPQQAVPMHTAQMQTTRSPSYFQPALPTRPAPYAPTQPTTPQTTGKTSAYGSNRTPRTTTSSTTSSKEPHNPCKIQRREPIVTTSQPHTLTKDLLGRVLEYIPQPFRLRCLCRQWNAAYLTAGPTIVEKGVQFLTQDTLSIPGPILPRLYHVRAICNNQSTTATKTWDALLKKFLDQNLVNFFHGILCKDLNLQTELIDWATQNNKQKEMDSVAGKAACIREWMKSHPTRLQDVTDVYINNQTVEWPEEAALLEQLKTVVIFSHCRKDTLAAIGKMPSVNSIKIIANTTDMCKEQDWPRSIWDGTTQARSIEVKGKLSHSIPEECITKFLQSNAENKFIRLGASERFCM